MAITIRALTEADLDALSGLLQSYSQQHPQRACMPVQIYLSPYFDSGRRVACAFDEPGRLLGYAPYFPQGDQAWVEVMSQPGLEETLIVKAALWAWILDQARRGSQKKLLFQYGPSEDAAIRFAMDQGGQLGYTTYIMRRDLSLPIPALSMPGGFTLRRWRMETEPEQRQYLDARNACFPEAQTSLEEWQFFAGSPEWEQGTNMAAFTSDRLAASVLVYWPPGSPAGSTEHVFTLTEYRGHGLARVLLAEALSELKAHGLQYAGLEVKAGNRAALGVYTGLGYQVVSETMVYEVEIDTQAHTD